MKQRGTKAHNFPETMTLAAGERRTHNAVGASFFLSANSLTATNLQVAIDEDNLNDWPLGYRYESPPGETFTKIGLYNPAASAMTITFWVSLGAVNDERTVISGEVIIDPAGNAVSTPAAVVALPITAFLIDNAAAVNKGGGLVGIPVTAQPFASGETVTIANTINYNGDYAVDPTSSADEVVITATYVAETFDGVDDSIKLKIPRSIASAATRRELEVHNHDGTRNLYWGDANVDPDNQRGIPVTPGNGHTITSEAQIYFAALSAAGKSGTKFSYAEHTRA